MNKRTLLAVFLCALLGAGCSVLNVAGGGSSQQGNGVIMGTAVYSGSLRPASHALVHLRPADYLRYPNEKAAVGASRLRDVWTDSLGRFSIDSLDTGRYAVEIVEDPGTHGVSAALLYGTVTRRDSVVVLSRAYLKPTGVIKGTFAAISDSISRVHVQLYGIDRTASIDTVSRTCVFESVPEGVYSACVVAPNVKFNPPALSAVPAISNEIHDVGQVDLLPFNAWQGVRKLFLNTTATGADVKGTVIGFPVLLRLTSANFNFPKARANGEDLRFAKSDGTPLPYEIEQWNAQAGHAEVWVRVDTVYGDNLSQSITMFWGNPNAPSASNSGVVFDTGLGFQGVWHMTGPAAAMEYDATINQYNGSSADSAPQVAPGNIGSARRFNGTSNFITMPGTAASKLNFPENGVYTVSAWVFVDTCTSAHQIIVSKGNYQYQLSVNPYTAWDFSEFQDRVGWDTTASPAAAGGWHYVVGIRAGSKQYLYVNGLCTDSTIGVCPMTNVSRNTGSDLTLGKLPGPGSLASFKGMIDEVRIANRSCSAAWIKLSYMNQKQGDRLIQF